MDGVCYPKFWILFFMNVCGASFGVFMAAAFKTYGMENIFNEKGLPDDYYLSFIGALTGIANGITRFLWALWMDHSGFIVVYRTLLVINLFCSLFISYFASSHVGYAVIVFLSLSCMGGHYSLWPTVTMKVFGLKYGPDIYSIMFYSFGTTAMLGLFYV
jgi:hypothetical protein